MCNRAAALLSFACKHTPRIEPVGAGSRAARLVRTHGRTNSTIPAVYCILYTIHVYIELVSFLPFAYEHTPSRAQLHPSARDHALRAWYVPKVAQTALHRLCTIYYVLYIYCIYRAGVVPAVRLQARARPHPAGSIGTGSRAARLVHTHSTVKQHYISCVFYIV